MKTMKQHKIWGALVALVLVLGACKGESPTAPPSGSGNNGGGGTPPATGVTLTLTTSSNDPLVDSSVVITATVTQNNQPVPNGTAVEFVASGGGFDGTSGTSVLKTTTNGVATVTLTSSVAGPITVRATVNNVVKNATVTFRTSPIVDPPIVTAPSITAVTPAVTIPSGGQHVTITGVNFAEPLKVLFDIGQALPVEALVVSSTATSIDVLTPSVNLGVGQQLVADVIVITRAGTANEQRAEKTGAITFRAEVLTPHISTASPNSGPVVGGTEVTIFGDGFQAPVQVLFGAAEARVVDVGYSQIIVVAPAARDTTDDGSGTVTGQVPITVRNINSQKEATMSNGFHYVAAMQITTAGPTEGPAGGGTRVEINGIGFVGPVAVSIAGVAAQPVFVSGTKVIALTSGVLLNSCSDIPGPIIVTNEVNGDTATGPDFIYRVAQPLITNVSPSTVTAGNATQILVANAQPGPTRITLGGRSVFPTGAVTNPATGITTYTVIVPTNFTFPTQACGTNGTQNLPLVVDVTYLNVQSTCTDTASQALTINPVDTSCVLPPPPEVSQTVPIPPNCADAGNVVAAGTVTGTATITFANSGGQTLNVSRGAVSDPQFTVSPANQAIAPGQNGSFTVTFDPAAPGAANANVTFNTNDADEGTIIVCLTGNGT